MRIRRGLLLALSLALAGPPLAARAEDAKPAKSNTAIDLKEVGRNIGQLGKEIKEAGQKVGDGVKEGSRSKSSARPKSAGRKATAKAPKAPKKSESGP